MATTQATVHQTNFEVAGIPLRFGILWAAGAVLMNDWARESRLVELAGPGGFTETQLLGFGPYKVDYALFFETVADYQALAAVVQQTGTLTIVHGAHTLPDPDDGFYFPRTDTAYDRFDGVLLAALVGTGVAPDGTVEAVASFSRGSS